MTHVPYKGSGQAIQDVLAGQVQVFISTPPSLMQHIQSGKLKGLAVTGKNRHPGMPNVPTTAEAYDAKFGEEDEPDMSEPAPEEEPMDQVSDKEIEDMIDAMQESARVPMNRTAPKNAWTESLRIAAGLK